MDRFQDWMPNTNKYSDISYRLHPGIKLWCFFSPVWSQCVHHPWVLETFITSVVSITQVQQLVSHNATVQIWCVWLLCEQHPALTCHHVSEMLSIHLAPKRIIQICWKLFCLTTETRDLGRWHHKATTSETTTDSRVASHHLCQGWWISAPLQRQPAGRSCSCLTGSDCTTARGGCLDSAQIKNNLNS